jgi:hypothetical protein
MIAQKKITLATFKSFVRKNTGSLLIQVETAFDSMTDGLRCERIGFRPVAAPDNEFSNNLGIRGVWLVGGSGNYFSAYEDEYFTGIRGSNCCGSFILAVAKKTDANTCPADMDDSEWLARNNID